MSDVAGALSGFSEIATRYDALFCDIWGVVHNGVVATPHWVDGLTMSVDYYYINLTGGNATISFTRGNLVVSAPRSVHEMLSSN